MGGQCPSCRTAFPTDGGYCPNDGTRIVSTAPAQQDGLVGRSLDGRYEIRDALMPALPGAIGAMYRGIQLSVSREVAIKIVHPAFAADIDAVERFRYAGRSAAQLVAPAIANVYDVGRTSDGILYVVSELVRGVSLSEARGRSLPVRRVVGIAIQLADALTAIHREHLVHGDLDPASVVVDESSIGDQVKLLDVGLACAFGPSRSPTYCAPEQFDGNAADARSDQYALGVILYELLAGTPPFVAASIEALAGKHRHERPPQLPPNIPVSLASIVYRLLAKQPAERYATCSDLRAHLAAVQAEVGMAPRASSAGIALPRTSSADLLLPRTRSADLQLPRTASADFAMPRTTSAEFAVPRTRSADYTPTPPVVVEPRSSRLLVIILVVLIVSGGGIAAILLVG